MKKSFLLSIILIFLGSTIAFGYNPIPSFNVPVYQKSNFLEKPGVGNKHDAKGRRNMNIRITTLPTVVTTIWIYSIDGKNIQGPFVVIGDGLISIPIDDRDWGTYIESDGHTTVDVWTSATL